MYADMELRRLKPFELKHLIILDPIAVATRLASLKTAMPRLDLRQIFLKQPLLILEVCLMLQNFRN